MRRSRPGWTILVGRDGRKRRVPTHGCWAFMETMQKRGCDVWPEGDPPHQTDAPRSVIMAVMEELCGCPTKVSEDGERLTSGSPIDDTDAVRESLKARGFCFDLVCDD